MEILALEASTTSAKAMLYHTDTHTFEVVSKEYVGQGDPNTRDADEIFRQTMAVGRQLAQGRSIDMISLGGTWHSILACDRDMKPLSPVYFWDFTGASHLCRSLRLDEDYTRSFYQRTGCMVNAIYPAFKIKWLLKSNEAFRSARFVHLGAYFTYRMTGALVTTRCLVSGSGLLNAHTREYDEEVLRDLGIRADQLNRLTDYTETAPLTKEAAALLGVSSGIPVIPANSDGGLNQVGVGASEQGVATLSVGTSGAIRLSTDRPIIPDTPSTWCYQSPKSWLSGAATNGCCSCIDWARTKLFPAGASYNEIEQGVTDPINTPVFLPFLYGERCPGWNDRRQGGFMNLLPTHNASDMYLAVQEGVLFNLYHCYQILTKVSGEPKTIKVSGGILNSPRWLQMCADIFDRTLTLDHVVQGSLLGGSVLAMELLGVIDDATAFSPASAGTVEPNSSASGLYLAKFERYLECYNRNA